MNKQFKLGALFAGVALLTLTGAKRHAVAPPFSPPVVGPTFSKEVVRIFQTNCQSCHHPGDIAPFSLMTYQDALPHAFEIKANVVARVMPPWKPVTSCSELNAPRVLSADDIATIKQWVDNGAPEGKLSDLPKPLD